MRQQILWVPIAMLVLVVALLVGCSGAPATPTPTPTPTSEGFAIYLLANDTPVSEMSAVSHLELENSPLVSTDDIVSYKQETHELELTGEACERLSGLHVPSIGRVFVVSVDRYPVYRGAFWTPISSLSFDGVTIVKPLSQHECPIQIQLGYLSSEFFTGTDPRSDPQVLRALERAGKLT